MSEISLWSGHWRFFEGEPESTVQQVMELEDSAWQWVDLPHDWQIFHAGDLYRDGRAWYRKNLQIKKSDLGTDRIAIRFEGVYMDSRLYVNGEPAGEWKYGYSAFEFDITDLLADGANDILLGACFREPNSRWYSGAGIYRNVRLVRYPRFHIAPDGVYISTKRLGPAGFENGECAAEGNTWQVDVTTEVAGAVDERPEVSFAHTLYRFDASAVGRHRWEEYLRANPQCLVKVLTTDRCPDRVQTFLVEEPELWDLTSPNLYILETVLSVDGRNVDQRWDVMGFRTAAFDPEKGFFLNGKHVLIRGVCMHHDLGCLGAAVNKQALRRQFQKLADMGVNAIRTSHNMPSREFMELADEMGMLVDSEAFDMWEIPKTEYDYARYFNEWADRDVESWVKGDRNHPSLILWSIGNEISDTHVSDHGREITERLSGLVRQFDCRCNAPVTIASNYMYWDGAQKCAELVKYAGYNYSSVLYEEHHRQHPDWVIYGSETGSVVASRGVYHFPLAASILTDDDEQCSSLGNSTTSWGAKNVEECVITGRDFEFSAGQFIWTGFDYIGEPTPYHTRNSYFGMLDTAGFAKDGFYLLKAGWTDHRVTPMVHVFPYWDFNPGQMIDVRVCSNAPSVELFLNGNSLGKKEIDHRNGSVLTADYCVPYESGELKAVAYDEAGKIIAGELRRSFGEAAKIVLTCEEGKRTLTAKCRAGGSDADLCFVEISMVDEAGNPVENADNRVTVRVTGAGYLVGLDNGDSTDYDEYKGNSRRLFSGKLLAVIAPKDVSGRIEVTVSSLGLPEAKMILDVVKDENEGNDSSEKPLFSDGCFDNSEEYAAEVPVRSVLLTAKGERLLTKERPSVIVEAAIRPDNATCRKLAWRVTTDCGADTNPAKLEVLDEAGLRVKVTALGDGEFRVRCSAVETRETFYKSRTQGDAVKLYSQLEFSAEGLG